ncbi:MAG: ATP-binding cassette domain-containing protein [Acidimicrobiales bacterium]
MPSPEPVLSYHRVTHRFGRSAPVLTELTLDVPAGRVVLLGPNGAGKTTMLRLGAGLLRPTGGRVESYALAVGYTPQAMSPLAGATALEQVAYAAWLAGVDDRAARRVAGESLERVGLSDAGGQSASTLSGGQLRRVGIAQALAAGGDVLLLDEPAAGLDPLERRRLAAVVAQLDASVVISTHLVDDIAATFDQVVVLAAGEVRFQGPVADFLSLGDARDGTPADAYAVAVGAVE